MRRGNHVLISTQQLYVYVYVHQRGTEIKPLFFMYKLAFPKKQQQQWKTKIKYSDELSKWNQTSSCQDFWFPPFRAVIETSTLPRHSWDSDLLRLPLYYLLRTDSRKDPSFSGGSLPKKSGLSWVRRRNGREYQRLPANSVWLSWRTGLLLVIGVIVVPARSTAGV